MTGALFVLVAEHPTGSVEWVRMFEWTPLATVLLFFPA